jgi:hypothetical protein
MATPVSAQNMPPPKEQLQLDIERLRRTAEAAEASGVKRELLRDMWLVLAEKKDIFRNLTSLTYDVPLDVIPADKKILKTLFDQLKGSWWDKKFGWAGQAKTTSQPDTPPCDAEAQLYNGLKTRKLWSTDDKAAAIVTGFNMTGVGCNGPLPMELCGLKQCQFIRLNWNLISGTYSIQLTAYSLQHTAYSIQLTASLLAQSTVPRV